MATQGIEVGPRGTSSCSGCVMRLQGVTRHALGGAPGVWGVYAALRCQVPWVTPV
jgi:hypothetical protein